MSSSKKRQPIHRDMTVANIRLAREKGDVEIAFLESAQFYTLPASSLDFDRVLLLLQGSMARRQALRIVLSSATGTIIQGVQLVR